MSHVINHEGDHRPSVRQAETIREAHFRPEMIQGKSPTRAIECCTAVGLNEIVHFFRVLYLAEFSGESTRNEDPNIILTALHNLHRQGNVLKNRSGRHELPWIRDEIGEDEERNSKILGSNEIGAESKSNVDEIAVANEMEL